MAADGSFLCQSISRYDVCPRIFHPQHQVRQGKPESNEQNDNEINKAITIAAATIAP